MAHSGYLSLSRKFFITTVEMLISQGRLILRDCGTISIPKWHSESYLPDETQQLLHRSTQRVQLMNELASLHSDMTVAPLLGMNQVLKGDHVYWSTCRTMLRNILVYGDTEVRSMLISPNPDIGNITWRPWGTLSQCRSAMIVQPQVTVYGEGPPPIFGLAIAIEALPSRHETYKWPDHRELPRSTQELESLTGFWIPHEDFGVLERALLTHELRVVHGSKRQSWLTDQNVQSIGITSEVLSERSFRVLEDDPVAKTERWLRREAVWAKRRRLY